MHVLDPINVLRAFFLLAAAGVVAGATIPALRSRFIEYGVRATPPKHDDTGKPITKSPKEQHQPKNALEQTLDYLAAYQVSHGRFAHFYTFSVLSSLVWAEQILRRGWLFERLVDLHRRFEALSLQEPPSMTVEQVGLCWMLMLIQGLRRLYESVVVSKPSKSSMWAAHWVLGLVFYAAMGVAVWIEGMSALEQALEDSPRGKLVLRGGGLPTVRTMLAVVLFFSCALVQHIAHLHLASLRTYTIPPHPLFAHVLCPHYLAECGIYIALSIAGSPSQHLNRTSSGGKGGAPHGGSASWGGPNMTLLTATVFVVANLGVTARGTQRWYLRRFGADKVGARWGMVPGIL